MVVTRRGEHRLADPNAALGAGRDSMYSPLRQLDYVGALDDTIAQSGDMMREKVEDVVAFIKATTGIDLSGVAALLTMPVGQLGGTELGKALEVLATFIPGLSGSDPATFDLEAAATEFIETVLNPTGAILAALDPTARINAGMLFGQLPPSILSLVPVASLMDYRANVLPNPGFDAAEAIVGSLDWTIDNTVGRIAESAVIGSATLLADGEQHQLMSDPGTETKPAVPWEHSVWLRWRGVTAAGPAWRLVAVAYASHDGTGTPLSETILATISSPGTDSFNADPDEDDFVELPGAAYTVPAGANSIRHKVVQTANVTAGQLWVDDALQSPNQLIQEGWVENLAAKIANLDLAGLLDATSLSGVLPQFNIPLLDEVKVPALQDTWDNLWNAVFGDASTGRTAAEAGNAVADVSTRTNNVQYSTQTLQGFFNEPRVLPAYVGALADSVAFDRDTVDGTTTPALGTLVLIPVKITQDRIIDAIKFGCTANAMTNLFVGLYDVDETTGNLSKVLDLGDRKADLDLAFLQQTCEFASSVAVQRGELYYIGILQVGGTAAPLHRKAASFNMTDGLFPKYLGSTWATTGVSTLPSSIASADVVSGTRYWGALGTAAAPLLTGGVFLTDNFNRADASTLGPNWTTRNGNVGVGSNKVATAFASSGVATHNTRLNSTSQKAGLTISTYSLSVNDVLGVSVRGNGLGPCVELALTVNNTPTAFAQIRTRPSYGGTPVVRATFTVGTQAAQFGQWTIEAAGNTYTGYLNGVQKPQWIDSGGAFPVAANNTEVGAFTNQDQFYSFDDWLAQDL